MKRYRLVRREFGGWDLNPHKDGEVIYYDDHAAEVAKLREIVRGLVEAEDAYQAAETIGQMLDTKKLWDDALAEALKELEKEAP